MSHRGYFMVCAATTVYVLYWKTDQPFVVNRSHHVWFDEYNCCLYIEDNITPVYLLLQQYPESLIHNSYSLDLIPNELNLTSTPFRDTKLLTYEV